MKFYLWVIHGTVCISHRFPYHLNKMFASSTFRLEQNYYMFPWTTACSAANLLHVCKLKLFKIITFFAYNSYDMSVSAASNFLIWFQVSGFPYTYFNHLSFLSYMNLFWSLELNQRHNRNKQICVVLPVIFKAAVWPFNLHVQSKINNHTAIQKWQPVGLSFLFRRMSP